MMIQMIRHQTRFPSFPILSAIVIAVTVLAMVSSCATAPEPAAGITGEEAPADEFTDPFEDAADPYDRISAAIVLGDPAAAIEAYEAANLENPEDPGTRVLLANLYIVAGDTEGARAILDEVLAGDDQSAAVDARMALSLIERILGDSDGELEQLVAVLDLEPEHPRANAALGELLLERGDYDEAERRFETAVAGDPEDFVALQGLGNTYLRNGKSQEAIGVFTDAIEIEPQYSYTFTDRARAYVEQGLVPDAVEDMDRAIALDPENGWHYIDRGRMKARSGEFAAADADFTRAAELIPGNFLAYAYRAQVRGYQGDYDGAAEDYYRVIDVRPDYYPSYAYLGALEFVRGNYRRSHEWLNRALAEEPEKPAYILFAGAALLAASEPEGRRYLEENLPRLERGSLLYLTGRYYVDNVDIQVLNALQTEENELVKALGQFYMGLRYRQKGLESTARALFDSAEQRALAGSPESLVRNWIVDESP
jgi:FimV-like protein